MEGRRGGPGGQRWREGWVEEGLDRRKVMKDQEEGGDGERREESGGMEKLKVMNKNNWRRKDNDGSQ